jgi:hypothetical protein
MRRLVGVVLITLGFLVGGVAALGAATHNATSASSTAVATATTSAASCAATRVHYERSREGSALPDLPWIAVGRGANRTVGYLFYYGTSVLGDSRFNRSSGVTIPVGGTIPAGDTSPAASAKILWFTRGKASSRLLLVGRRLDGPGTFRHTEDAASSPSGTFPSIIELPSAGCWRLTLKTGRVIATVVVQAVELPARPVCEPTLVRHDSNPRLGAPRWIELTPSSAGLYAIGSVSTEPESTEATIYPGSFYPGGMGTKIMWVPTRTERIGTVLVLTGTRLDEPANVPRIFRQQHRVAHGQTQPLVGPVFPSIVNVPSTGCWLLTLRTGQNAAIAVFRALEPGG